MKKTLVAMASVFGLVIVCLAISFNFSTVSAQQGTTNLTVRTSVADDSFEALKQRPVMVSVVKDGQVVKQMDALLNSSASFSVPAGLYDVRLEGDGMQTLVKRGIHVNEGAETSVIGGPMHKGVGVKVIEYATGGLSREEVAARLAKLETAVTELQKARVSKP